MSLAESWRITDNLELVIRDWDEDEVVVFSQRLGHSLLLSAPSARVLSLLAAATPSFLSLSTLAEQILPYCEPDTHVDEVMSLLDATLPEFYRIGLAEPVVNSN